MSVVATISAAIVPDWPSAQAVARVQAELHTRPPLVGYAECHALRDRLARVAAGHGYVLQGGDCAELFGEVSAATSARKVYQLHQVASVVYRATGQPVVRVGRLAGQFAKPRSHLTECGPDGRSLPVYRGDAVNDREPTVPARTADPDRMLVAYDKSAEVLGHLRGGPIYTSHEALLCEYEEPLIRLHDAVRYGSSGHLLWVGDRSRHPDGPHLDLLARVANPVAVKLGPSATASDVETLVDRLDPDRVPGRLVLVPRLGKDRVSDLLPALLAAAASTGARPVWLCDPMHGNTIRAGSGAKTRLVEDLVAEVTGFVEVLRAHRVHPGGLHLELTPDDVDECLDGPEQLHAGPRRYSSACDPRLNPTQAVRVAAAFATAVTL
jgi:3-deoxy-7-phosphoheptulonate synthase